VHLGEIRLARDDDVETVERAETADVEVLLHGVPGAEERHRVQAGLTDRVGGGVGDVQHRYGDRVLDLVGQPVHRVRAQHHSLGAAGDEVGRGLGQQPGGLVPPNLALQGLDLGEVERPDQ